METDKLIVATHEAGHAIVGLVTDFREYVIEAEVQGVDQHWEGFVRFDEGRERVDPHGVLEVAKGMGGPLAQLHYYRDSIPDGVKQRLEGNDLLGATKRVLIEEPSYQTHWWPDLHDWINFCHHKCQNPEDFVAIQAGLNAFFEHSAVEKKVRSFAELLARRDHLNRDELLAFGTSELPLPDLPKYLRCE